jgi:hypothetical protein
MIITNINAARAGDIIEDHRLFLILSIKADGTVTWLDIEKQDIFTQKMYGHNLTWRVFARCDSIKP